MNAAQSFPLPPDAIVVCLMELTLGGVLLDVITGERWARPRAADGDDPLVTRGSNSMGTLTGSLAVAFGLKKGFLAVLNG
jgi:hypothetical protein